MRGMRGGVYRGMRGGFPVRGTGKPVNSTTVVEKKETVAATTK